MNSQIYTSLSESMTTGKELKLPADYYYYLALSAGVIGVFASFIPMMPLFTFAFTYKSYLEGGRYKTGIILGIFNTLLAIFWIAVGAFINSFN
jgi:hypothetical protein